MDKEEKNIFVCFLDGNVNYYAIHIENNQVHLKFKMKINKTSEFISNLFQIENILFASSKNSFEVIDLRNNKTLEVIADKEMELILSIKAWKIFGIDKWMLAKNGRSLSNKSFTFFDI